MAVSAICRQLQDAGHAGTLSGAPELLTELERAFALARKEFDSRYLMNEGTS